MPEHIVSRHKALTITAQIEKAVADILKEHGFDAPKTKTTYGDRYVLRLETTPVEEGEGGINLNSPEAQEFNLHAPFLNVSADALGKEFKYLGEEYILVGFVSRRPKYPFVARRVSDGKTYKFPEAPLAAAFPKAD